MGHGNSFPCTSSCTGCPAIEVRKALAIVLVPQDRPLREEVVRVRVAGVVGHGPRQQLSLHVQLHRMSRDRRLVGDRGYRKGFRLLAGGGHYDKEHKSRNLRDFMSACHLACSDFYMRWLRTIAAGFSALNSLISRSRRETHGKSPVRNRRNKSEPLVPGGGFSRNRFP